MAERFDFFLGLLDASVVAKVAGILEFFLELGKACPVGGLGLRVQYFASVTKVSGHSLKSSKVASIAAFRVLTRLAADQDDQIERSQIVTRVREETRDVVETFGVLEARGFAAVSDSPVIAFTAELRFVRRRSVLRIARARRLLCLGRCRLERLDALKPSLPGAASTVDCDRGVELLRGSRAIVRGRECLSPEEERFGFLERRLEAVENLDGVFEARFRVFQSSLCCRENRLRADNDTRQTAPILTSVHDLAASREFAFGEIETTELCSNCRGDWSDSYFASKL